jgi:hypothetical protein
MSVFNVFGIYYKFPQSKLSLDIVYYAIQFILLRNFDELGQAVLTLPSENKLVLGFGTEF